jgi:hypothetical protein
MMGACNRRAARPSVEPFESRELLSSIAAILATSQSPHLSAASALALHLQQTGWAVVSGPSTANTSAIPTSQVSASQASTPINTGGTTLPQGNSLTGNNSSPLLGSGIPTPHELAREAFHAGFQGPSYVSPGRFSNQATTWYYRGTGGSSFFLHGDFDMAIVKSTDPTASFIGEAVLNDKSTGTGGILGLVLVGNATDVDPYGRPTKMTFTGDPNIYSGAFFVSAAEGTVTIRYGKGRSQPTAVIFDGRVYTNGLTNPLVNTDMYARHNRALVYRGPSAPTRT